MRARVLRSFPFSRDGVTVEHALIGDDLAIPDELVGGLVAEGWIALMEQERAPIEPAGIADESATELPTPRRPKIIKKATSAGKGGDR